MLRTSSTEIRDWLTKQFASLPPMNSKHEIRVALRKHEMSRLLDAERKKQDMLVHEAQGTLELGSSESGLAYRSAILHYATISSPIPANVIDVKLVYRWSVPATAASLDPGDDNEIVSYDGVAGGSPDGSKDLRFDYRKTDARFRPLDVMSPVIYKRDKDRMVFCVRFKEKGDSKYRWLIYKANSSSGGNDEHRESEDDNLCFQEVDGRSLRPLLRLSALASLDTRAFRQGNNSPPEPLSSAGA